MMLVSRRGASRPARLILITLMLGACRATASAADADDAGTSVVAVCEHACVSACFFASSGEASASKGARLMLLNAPCGGP